MKVLHLTLRSLVISSQEPVFHPSLCTQSPGHPRPGQCQLLWAMSLKSQFQVFHCVTTIRFFSTWFPLPAQFQPLFKPTGTQCTDATDFYSPHLTSLTALLHSLDYMIRHHHYYSFAHPFMFFACFSPYQTHLSNPSLGYKSSSLLTSLPLSGWRWLEKINSCTDWCLNLWPQIYGLALPRILTVFLWSFMLSHF